jgi:hypothetical protein
VYSRLRAKYGDDGTWTWLTLPEEYTPKFSTWYNGIGWKDKRVEGELLWPERFTAKVLADLKGVALEEIRERTSENASKLFSI